MTTVYFIRHAESDISVRDPQTRPLTPKGLKDRLLVTEFLQDKNISAVYSSPFKRAVDTVSDFAGRYGYKIFEVYDLRERLSDGNSSLMEKKDFFAFIKKQWDDFSFTLSDGECLNAVQKRNIDALNEILIQSENKNIAIGTHGTALSTIINHYDKSYGFDDFMSMVDIMPWVVKMDFDGTNCEGITKIDLFKNAD